MFVKIVIFLFGSIFLCAEVSLAAGDVFDDDYVVSGIPAVIVTADEIKEENIEIVDEIDKIENLNRGVYDFNNTVDRLFLAPVARGYRAIVPEWGRNRIGGAVNNLASPVSFVNSAMQGDAEQMFTVFWRFIINSTLGIGGMFDTAKEFGLEARKEDFGQTLAVYGVDSGSYIVLPFLGPSTTRDAFGKIVDILSNPFNYASFGAAIAIKSTDIIHSRSELLDLTDDIEQNSFDPYATVKSAYIQRRASEINNGEK